MSLIEPNRSEILGKPPIQVLDRGFVKLVDFMGSDQSIVNAARLSYGGKTSKKSSDAQLIDYLVRHQHTSPFEQVVFVFHLKMPIFVARQFLRHRTARVNELSGRYSVIKDEYYVPNRMPLQASDNKQGSASEDASNSDALIRLLDQSCGDSFSIYEDLLLESVSRETSRLVLPLSTYTELVWQMDLRNLIHFVRLRADSHAQSEIQEYAKAIYEIVRSVCPVSVASFDNHVLGSLTLSEDELDFIRRELPAESAFAIVKALEMLNDPYDPLSRKSRKSELSGKLGRLLGL